MKRPIFNVRLSEEEAITLMDIAFSLGYAYMGKGSIAKLNQAIAASEVIIVKKRIF